MARIDCPACGKDVATRRDGTPWMHLPPDGREDLLCEQHPSWPHCAGSHQEPANEVMKIHIVASPASTAKLTAVLAAQPTLRVVHDSGDIPTRKPGQVRRRFEAEQVSAQ